MRRVIIESPYGGHVAANEAYARAAIRECILRGESPYASHLLLTQPGVLNDLVPAERTLGINAGFEWRESADATVVYIDRGISKGMHYGIQDAIEKRHPLEFRRLGDTERLQCQIDRLGNEVCYRFYYCDAAKAPFSHFITL